VGKNTCKADLTAVNARASRASLGKKLDKKLSWLNLDVMKKAIIVVLALLAFAAPALAGDATITDRYGTVTGYVKPDGAITDRYGTVTGYAKPDGSVTDRYGTVQGYAKPDGSAVDRYGATQGYAKPDGTIHDRYGRESGTISP
jgi:hypothetical protein